MPDELPVALAGIVPDDLFFQEGDALWQTLDSVAGPAELWERCARLTGETGLWPVLAGVNEFYPISPQTPHVSAEVDAIDVTADLERAWRALRARQAGGFRETLGSFPEDLDGREEILAVMADKWAHGWPPYEQWPGLAPHAPSPAGPSGDGITICRDVLEQLTAGSGASEAGIALVGADRPADIPAVLAWDAEAPTVLLSALLRTWEDRFGARLIALEGASLHLAVPRPPMTSEHAAQVALEHMLLGDDLHSPGHLNFVDYARSLVGALHWQFWWD